MVGLFGKVAKKVSRGALSKVYQREDVDSEHQQTQLILKKQWIEWREQGKNFYKKIQQAGFRAYSQFEEDGIILYLLTMIAAEGLSVVEMCCGTGDECMAANLIINHGYKGYLFDGSEKNIARAKAFYSAKKDCLLVQPELRSPWITRENVNDLLVESGCPKEVDFFSLDIDDNDYWVWESIEAINPKVCCFETHDIIPSNKALTIPYDPQFCCWSQPPEMHDFRSVSLAAMTKLSNRKGYRLIGSHKHGFNVFYMRNDIGNDFFPEVSIEEIHNSPWSQYGQRERWGKVKHLNWVEV